MNDSESVLELWLEPKPTTPEERCTTVLSLMVALSLVAACDAASEHDRGTLCDPVSDVDRPAELLRPLAAGRDAEGVVYVLEQVGPELHVFVSEGADVLRRQPVMGDGESQVGAVSVHQATVEGDEGFTLLLRVDEIDGTQVLSKHPPGRVDPASSDGGEELEPVELSELDGFMVRGFAGEVVLEYYGEVIPDSRRVVVLRPSHDWSYEDFRVFIGTHDHMVEREVLRVERQRDGGSTTIEIMLDGEEATLTFPAVLEGTDIMPGIYSLEQNGKSVSILPLSDDTGSEGALLYFCR